MTQTLSSLSLRASNGPPWMQPIGAMCKKGLVTAQRQRFHWRYFWMALPPGNHEVDWPGAIMMAYLERPWLSQTLPQQH